MGCCTVDHQGGKPRNLESPKTVARRVLINRDTVDGRPGQQTPSASEVAEEEQEKSACMVAILK